MNKQLWIEEAGKQGFEGFEIYTSTSASRELKWYEGNMEAFTTSRVTGTSLRGIYNGKMAYLALENNDDSLREALIEKMKEQAKAISSDDVDVLRSPAGAEPLEACAGFVRPDAETIQKLLKTIEEKLLAYDERIFMINELQWADESSTREIINSCGLDVQDGTQMQMVIAGVAARENEEIKNAFHVEIVRDPAKLDVDGFVKKAAEKALLQLNSEVLASGSYDVIIENEAMTSLFASLSSMFSGDLISKGISPLRDKINTKVFSDRITIIDDPRNPDALMRAAYDDEGCPTSRKVLVDHGSFVTMLQNSRSAARMQTESTGNGFKSSYAAPVEVTPMNCYIEPSDISFEGLMEKMGEGLVITELAGQHAGINGVTTDFSLQCMGYYVKDGKRAQSVSLITIAGNFIDMMNRVEAVGSDLDWSYHTIASPSILFKGCAISGK